MPRARISKNGIELAMPGYDVDTAPPSKMVIDPQLSTMRIAHMGYLTVAPFTDGGIWSSDLDRASFTFPTPFSSIPMVFVSGVFSATETDQSLLVHSFEDGNGRYWRIPHYSVQVTTTGFTLYVMKSELTISYPVIPRTWKYFVFANRGG